MSEIAIAFDVPSLDDALALDAALGEGPEYAKVGLQLYTAAGPEAVRALKRRGRRVFLDLKLHDIPNTVRGAAAEASKLNADLLTVHATGGYEMLAAASAGVKEGGGGTRIVAVTVLTSLNAYSMPPGFQSPFFVDMVAVDLLRLAMRSGAAGIVCSAAELPYIRSTYEKPFLAVTPGIRPAGGDAGDQKRVATVADAVKAGAGLLVVGRPVRAAADPAKALAAIRKERDSAVAERATSMGSVT